MERNLFNLLGNNFMEELLVGLRPYLIGFFALVAAAGVGYGIYLAIWLAKAEHEEGRRKAWRRIFMALSSIMIIVILTIYMLSLDIGEVYDRENLAFRHTGNYDLYWNVFQFEENGSFPLILMFRGLGISSFYLDPTFGPHNVQSQHEPFQTARVELIPYRGWVLSVGMIPPETVWVFRITASVSVFIEGEMRTITIPFDIHVYNPITAPTPTPARPQGPPNIAPPDAPPGGGGNWWNNLGGAAPGGVGSPGGVNPGGVFIPPGGCCGLRPARPAGGFGWVSPVEGGTRSMPMTNSGMNTGNPANGTSRPCCCTLCWPPRNQVTSWARTGGNNGSGFPHNGQDISANHMGAPVIHASNIRRNSGPNLLAVGAGRVVYANGTRNYASTGIGNRIDIELTQRINGQIVVVRYGHLHSIAQHPTANRPLQLGDIVDPGQIIGVMGNTGDSGGVHLHWEVRLGGALKCPCCFY